MQSTDYQNSRRSGESQAAKVKGNPQLADDAKRMKSSTMPAPKESSILNAANSSHAEATLAAMQAERKMVLNNYDHYLIQ